MSFFGLRGCGKRVEGLFEKAVIQCRFLLSDVPVKRMRGIRSFFEFSVENSPLDVAVQE